MKDVGTAAGHSSPRATVTVDVDMHCMRMQLEQTDVVDVMVGQDGGEEGEETEAEGDGEDEKAEALGARQLLSS